MMWRTREWPTTWTQSLIITLFKSENLQLCQNSRTINLIHYSSKVILKDKLCYSSNMLHVVPSGCIWSSAVLSLIMRPVFVLI